MIKFSIFSNILSKKFIRSTSLKLHTSIEKFLNEHDKTQVSLLEEKCILVNENDIVIGSETKKNCHLIENIENGMLHRAFSIFLFDQNNRMLLQKRSEFKITYPNLWTNTCCSHPLFVQEELVDILGVKKAAKRRLFYEFGIDVNNIDDFQFITRIHYKALNEPFDNIFGEHEVDHILFIKGNFNVNHNQNEIKSYKYLTSDELKEVLAKNDDEWKFTPWFKMICNHFMFKWWLHLDNLDKIKDHKTIYKL